MASKKLKMTVMQQKEWTLNTKQLDGLIKCLQLDSLTALQKFAPKGEAWFSGEETQSEYKLAEKKILPLMWLKVTTDNFSDPGLIFEKDPCFYIEDLSQPKDSFLESKLIVFNVNNQDEGVQISMALESCFIICPREGIEYDPYAENSREVAMQIYQSNNMADFGFMGLELANEDPTHNWEVSSYEA